MSRGAKSIGIGAAATILLATAGGISSHFFAPASSDEGVVKRGFTGRQVWYFVVFADALQHQPFGAGWGSADQLVFVERSELIFSTHSQHLQLFHDLGALGYSLFLISWSVFLWRYWQAARSTPPDSAHYLLLCMAIGFMVAFFIAMITDSIWTSSLYYGDYGFFLLGLALFPAFRMQGNHLAKSASGSVQV